MSMARIFAHGELSAEQLDAVCAAHGLDRMHNKATGNFELKRAAAIHWLRTSGPQSKYVLDQGSQEPNWRAIPPEAA